MYISDGKYTYQTGDTDIQWEIYISDGIYNAYSPMPF